MSALVPLWAPGIDRVVEAASGGLGAPGGWATAALLGGAVAAVCGAIRIGEARATPRALLLGGLLVPLGVGTLLPAVGAIGTGLLGLVGWGIATVAGRRPAPASTGGPAGSGSPSAGVAAGFALAGLGLLHLAAVPWISTDPFVLAVLAAAALGGLGLGRLATSPSIGALLAGLGLAVGAELPPRLPGFALERLRATGGDDATLGYLLPLLLTGVVGAATGLGGGLLGGTRRAVAAGALAAVVLGQVGPALLGADEAAHALGIGFAILCLPIAVRGTSAARRLVAVLGPAAAAATVLLPSPSAESVPTDAAWRIMGDARALAQATKNARFLGYDTAAGGAERITIALRENRPWAWQRGSRRERFDDATRHADRFLGHLPALLGEQPPRRILVFGLGRGEVVDAARQSTPGSVEVVEPSAALLALARRRLPVVTTLLADPAVVIRRAAPRGGPWDAIIVDVPPAWEFGGGGAWLREGALQRIRRRLGPGGVAILRLPLDAMSPAELAIAGAVVGDVFPTVIAWLDPIDARHVVLTAWATEVQPAASTIIAAWERDVLRSDLAAAGLREPADLLERALTDQQGLALLGADGRDAGGTAVVSAARVRRGKATLPLAALSSAGRPVGSMISLEGLPPDVRAPLEERLADADTSRSNYLALLSYLAAGKTMEAVGLAAELGKSSTNPARDLRLLIAPWLRRGRALRAEGKLEKAQAELATAYAFSPTDAEVNLEMARTLLALSRADEAVPYVQRARDADPTSVEPVLLLADIRIAQGRLADAAEGLTKAEPLFPTEVRLLLNLGYVLTQLSVGSDETIGARLARARVLFQRAASLAPRMPQPRAGLAEVYYRQGDGESALREIDRALLLAPSCQYRSWRGHILADLSRLEEAESALQAAILECPDLLDALVMLGAVVADRGRPKEARQMWERALEVDPTNAAARENLEILEASKLEEFVEQTRP